MPKTGETETETETEKRLRLKEWAKAYNSPRLFSLQNPIVTGMSTFSSKTSPPPYDLWRNRLELLLERTAQSATTVRSLVEFWGNVLPHWVQSLEADEGTIWWCPTPTAPLRRLLSTPATPSATGQDARSAEPDAEIVAAQQPCLIKTTPWNGSTSPLPTTAISSWLCPLRVAGQRRGVLELRFSRPVPAAVNQASDSLCTALAHSLDRLMQRLEWNTLSRQLEQSELLGQFILQLNRTAELTELCQMVVDESRRLLACDRVAIALPHGSRWQVRAISGVDLIDRRAKSLLALEQFVAAVARAGEPLKIDEGAELPPELAECWASYTEWTAVREGEAVPLLVRCDLPVSRAAGEPGAGGSPVPGLGERVIGWLIAERFTADKEAKEALSAPLNMRTLAQHVAPVLERVSECERVPLWRFWRQVAAWREAGLAKVGWGRIAMLFLLAGGGVVLSLWPVEFTIRARGRLQPRDIHHLFAAADGRVSKVTVDHGTEVRAGELLIELTNRDLDYEFARVDGELETTRARLASLAPRLNSRPTTPAEVTQRDADVAEVERQKTLQAGLLEQRALLLQRRDELRLLAPHDGRVMTWNLQQTLADRPVRRGQLLLTLADLRGNWELDLTIRDADVGHVLQAQQNESGLQRRAGAGVDIQQGLPVRFVLATDPETVHPARLARIALATELAADDTPVLRLIAHPDRTTDAASSSDRSAKTTAGESSEAVRRLNIAAGAWRPGAEVLAEIDCGQRTLAYVWTRRLIEAFLRRFW